MKTKNNEEIIRSSKNNYNCTTSDITPNSAVLNWEGDAEEYNVSYFKAFFYDSFEEDNLSQWTIYKNGDDGSTEWTIENPTESSSDLSAHSGNYAVVSYSDTNVHADNWLITPQITMPTQASLKFWVMRSMYDDAQDEYEVLLSTTGNSISDFTTILKEKIVAHSYWTEVIIDLSNYSGQQCYIAIHHDYTGGFFIMVDDFSIYGWSEPIVTTENSYLIENLLPNTEYGWRVQEQNQNSWVNSSFTTLPLHPTPFNIVINNETAYGSTISWTGYGDSYEILVGQLETLVNYSEDDVLWITYSATESPYVLNDSTNILPETSYLVKVRGFIDNEPTDFSESVLFTTLDENTKVFITDGEWNNSSNWVPEILPSISDNVILRANANIFDVAEANNITIENDVKLFIEDGGQLKTNANVEATMKKFIIGYGTDYAETTDGYYLLAFPISTPISASDANLVTTGESNFDLYSWDRPNIDWVWESNYSSNNIQNGIGLLYANQDDMEMNFTTILLNSSSSVTYTPSYNNVTNGGWNFYGNPFPCNGYITTEDEDLTFYRLMGNEFIPLEGPIAPLEGFFAVATDTGQTFTISREIPEDNIPTPVVATWSPSLPYPHYQYQSNN